MRPTLRQLQYLVAISENGKFSEAARRMNVSQPSLSAQIADMELELGCKLIERGRHGAILTPDGDEVTRRARVVLGQVAELRRIGEASSDQLSGRIKLGVIPSVGPYLLPQATRTLHQQFPQLRLGVFEGRTIDIDQHLRDGRLDTLISTATDHPETRHIPIFSEELWICVPPDSPLGTSREPVKLNALKGYSLLSLGHGHHLNLVIRHLAHQCGAFVSAEYEGTSLDAVRQMAAMGAGVAILPSLYAIVEASKDASLVVRRIDHPQTRREISLIWRDTSPLGESFKRLSEFLADAASGLLAGKHAD